MLRNPDIGDVFVRREAAKGLKPKDGVVGGHENGEVRAPLIVAAEVEAVEGGLLDGTVYSFDLAVDPGMVRPGEPLLDVIRVADRGEGILARRGGVLIAGLFGKLDANVR